MDQNNYQFVPMVDGRRKDQIDGGGGEQPPLRKMDFVRHRSTSSCYSTRSFASNATGSSTRSRHRRCKLEVSSFFLSDNNSPKAAGEYYQSVVEHHTPTERHIMNTYKRPATLNNTARQVSDEEFAIQESYSPHTTATSEMRGPKSDRLLSPSGSSHVRDTLAWLGSPFSNKSSSSPREQQVAKGDIAVDTLDPKQLRAVEMIKELSFDFSPPTSTTSNPKNNVSKSTASTSTTRTNQLSMLPVSPDCAVPAHYSNEMHIQENQELLRPTSPPLPPKISRIGLEDHPFSSSSADVGAVPVQIMHNRNRARSSSISEMSESYLNEFLFNAGEDNDSSSSLSHSSHEDNNGVLVKKDKKKALKTIENNLPVSPNLAPRPHPVSLWNRGRSSSCASDMSSYVSSSSSDNDNSIESSAEEEEEDILGNIQDQVFNQERLDSGNLSLDGKCSNSYDGGDGHNPEHCDKKVLRPRLNEETLREWNIMCEEEYSSHGMVTKDQFIFRALSCPYKMNATASPERAAGMISRVNDNEDDLSSVEEPHLLASPANGLDRVISHHSLFSYTNSGSLSSSSSSTISSQNKNDLDEVISDLDFDMGFIYSYSLEKSSFSIASPKGGVGKSHIRSKSSGKESVDRGEVGKGHRRSMSAGRRLDNKPVGLPKAVSNQVLNQPEDARPPSKPPTHRHRRFKSDGQIFMCKENNNALSQMNFSFSEGPSFKKKYYARHQRVQSLGSFTDSQFFDCSPLHCILEEVSKNSNSTDYLPLFDVVAFMKPYLQSLNTRGVLEVGFLMGLVFGLLIPYLFRMVARLANFVVEPSTDMLLDEIIGDVESPGIFGEAL